MSRITLHHIISQLGRIWDDFSLYNLYENAFRFVVFYM